MKRITILQPSYIPWIGAFHQMQKSDVFIFFDDVQYSHNTWRNRNRIKDINNEPQFLTIPVKHKNFSHSPINSIEIVPQIPWRKKHLKTIQANYAKATYFKNFFPKIKEIIEYKSTNLSKYTIHTTKKFADLIGIKTKFETSSHLTIPSYKTPTDRLIKLCQLHQATHYLTGDSAKDYLEEDQFKTAGIKLEYHNYNHPTYNQLGNEFIPYLSIIDLLLNEGENALSVINQNQN